MTHRDATVSASSSPSTTTSFLIRPATIQDIPVMARHRADMFRAMGRLVDPLYDQFLIAARRYFERILPAGEYFGWLVAPCDRPETIIGGAGIQIRGLPPTPNATGTEILQGTQGYIANVYTEPEWRRRGIARLIVEHLLDWSRQRGLSVITLHASDEGRPLYEQLGFMATNEMRYRGKQ